MMPVRGFPAPKVRGPAHEELGSIPLPHSRRSRWRGSDLAYKGEGTKLAGNRSYSLLSTKDRSSPLWRNLCAVSGSPCFLPPQV